MKKYIKIILKVIVSFFAFILLYMLCAFLVPKISVNNKKTSNYNKQISIYILTNGVHTDLVLPIKNQYKNWSTQIKYSNTIAKDTTAKLIAMGWGDKGFYINTPTWADLKFSTAFKASTSLSSSAMHCTFYKGLNETKNCKKITISTIDYIKLVQYIEASFQENNKEFSYIKTNAVYGKNDAFYDAKGSYNLFYTCNTWANSALKTANQKAAIWTVTDTGIFQHY